MQVSELSRVESDFVGLRRLNDSQYGVYWESGKVGMISLDMTTGEWVYGLVASWPQEFSGTFEQCVEAARCDHNAFLTREHVEVLEVSTKAVPAYVAHGGAWRSAGSGNKVLVTVRGVVFDPDGRRLPEAECYQQGVWVGAEYAQGIQVGQRMRLVQKRYSFFLREV